MDMKAKEAEALRRSSTFYPEGVDRSEPTSLNQKYHTDEFWGDSMPAALSGHPGAYYATVMGGEVGAQYTAQAIVSPPNDARFWDSDNSRGVLDYLGHNVATFGSGDPDKFTPLDFDNHNLDFLLVSNELYAYNDEPSYTYLENPDLIDILLDAEPNYERWTLTLSGYYVDYITGPEYALDQIKSRDSYLFRQNTLGYLTKEVRRASNGNLTTIRATCVDGQPQYIFTTGEDIVPKSTLFQPLIVSPERYEELESRGLVDGYIVVDVQASSFASSQGIDTRGVDPNELTTEERSLYEAKIPLADTFGGFDYPIKSIEVYGISDDQVIDSRSLTASEYNISLGNLYFTKSLEQLIPIFVNPMFYNMLTIEFSSNPVTLPSEEFYYKFVIKVAKIVPDDGSEEATRNALGIATNYAVMDYFDQYTYAQTSAQMIAEIGYTEIMTITSTAISAPLVALGSYAAMSAQEAIAAATKGVVAASSRVSLKTLVYEIGKRVVIGTIKETVEEIVVDGYFETAIQSAVRMTGGTDAAGHWASTLFTSLRETANFGYLTGSTGTQTQQGLAGQIQNLETYVSTGMALNGETSLARFTTDYEQFITAKMEEIGILGESLMESKISLGRILATGIFTGLSLLAPSLAGFNLYAISKLVGGIGSKIDAKVQNKFLASRNSIMLQKHSEEIERPKAELGKKHINAQPEANLPKDIPRISNMPEGANPLIAHNHVELELGTAVGATSSGFVYMSERDPNRDTNQRNLDPFIKEKEARNIQKVKDHLAKVEQMSKESFVTALDLVSQDDEKKLKLFDGMELYGFDPHDSSLKYPLTDTDTMQEVLFKTILNIIYKNQKTIENAYKKKNTIGLVFYDGETINDKGSIDFISARNLGLLMGPSRQTMRIYLNKIDNNQGLVLSLDMIRKTRLTLEESFEPVNLRDMQFVIRTVIDKYLSLEYTGISSITVEFLTSLDDETNHFLSTVQVGRQLGNGDNYFRSLMIASTYKSKFFNFITNLHLVDGSKLGFSDSKTYSKFKEEITHMTYKILASPNVGVIKDHPAGKLRFDALCLTLAALTKLRFQKPHELAQYICRSNPKGYYTIGDLSDKLSTSEQLIARQLRTGNPTFALGQIKKYLLQGIQQNIKLCSEALNEVNFYLNNERPKALDIGNHLHPLYQYLDYRYLYSKGVRSAHEAFIYRNNRIDTFIERNDNLKEIEKLQSVVSVPKSIRFYAVDYTVSTDLDHIEEKLDKHYQSDDRYLLIVLLGKKNPDKINKLKDMLESRRRDSTYNNLDHVQILTASEYSEFLDFDGDFKKDFDRYEQFSFEAFRSQSSWLLTLEESSGAHDHLYDIPNRNWYKRLL
jgi:hypothetical protein